MMTWEYASILNDGPVPKGTLDGLGSDRWELVSVLQGAETRQLLYVFKRPTQLIVSPEPSVPDALQDVAPPPVPGQSVF